MCLMFAKNVGRLKQSYWSAQQRKSLDCSPFKTLAWRINFWYLRDGDVWHIIVVGKYHLCYFTKIQSDSRNDAGCNALISHFFHFINGAFRQVLAMFNFALSISLVVKDLMNVVCTGKCVRIKTCYAWYNNLHMNYSVPSFSTAQVETETVWWWWYCYR